MVLSKSLLVRLSGWMIMTPKTELHWKHSLLLGYTNGTITSVYYLTELAAQTNFCHPHLTNCFTKVLKREISPTLFRHFFLRITFVS